MASAGEVRAVYRALLRVRRKAFAGDEPMLAAAAAQIRSQFDANRTVTDPAMLEQCLTQAREAVDFIGLNVVQAKLNDSGHYHMKLEQSHTGESLEEVVVKNEKDASPSRKAAR